MQGTYNTQRDGSVAVALDTVSLGVGETLGAVKSGLTAKVSNALSGIDGYGRLAMKGGKGGLQFSNLGAYLSNIGVDSIAQYQSRLEDGTLLEGAKKAHDSKSLVGRVLDKATRAAHHWITPVYGLASRQDKAITRAMQAINEHVQDGNIAGATVYELMEAAGVNNRATRKVVEKLATEMYNVEGEIVNPYVIKDGFLGKISNYANKAGLGLIGDGLQFYHKDGEGKLDTFLRNAKVGGEVQAAVTGTALGMFGAGMLLYSGAGVGAEQLREHGHETGSTLIDLALTGLFVQGAIASGNAIYAARAANSIAGTVSKFSAKKSGKKGWVNAAKLSGLGGTAGLLATLAGCDGIFGTRFSDYDNTVKEDVQPQRKLVDREPVVAEEPVVTKETASVPEPQVVQPSLVRDTSADVIEVTEDMLEKLDTITRKGIKAEGYGIGTYALGNPKSVTYLNSNDWELFSSLGDVVSDNKITVEEFNELPLFTQKGIEASGFKTGIEYALEQKSELEPELLDRERYDLLHSLFGAKNDTSYYESKILAAFPEADISGGNFKFVGGTGLENKLGYAVDSDNSSVIDIVGRGKLGNEFGSYATVKVDVNGDGFGGTDDKVFTTEFSKNHAIIDTGVDLNKNHFQIYVHDTADDGTRFVYASGVENNRIPDITGPFEFTIDEGKAITKDLEFRMTANDPDGPRTEWFIARVADNDYGLTKDDFNICATNGLITSNRAIPDECGQDFGVVIGYNDGMEDVVREVAFHVNDLNAVVPQVVSEKLIAEQPLKVVDLPASDTPYYLKRDQPFELFGLSILPKFRHDLDVYSSANEINDQLAEQGFDFLVNPDSGMKFNLSEKGNLIIDVRSLHNNPDYTYMFDLAAQQQSRTGQFLDEVLLNQGFKNHISSFFGTPVHRHVITDPGVLENPELRAEYPNLDQYMKDNGGFGLVQFPKFFTPNPVEANGLEFNRYNLTFWSGPDFNHDGIIDPDAPVLEQKLIIDLFNKDRRIQGWIEAALLVGPALYHVGLNQASSTTNEIHHFFGIPYKIKGAEGALGGGDMIGDAIASVIGR